MKKVGLIILLGLIILSVGCGDVAPSLGTSGDIPGEISSEESALTPDVHSLPEESELPIVDDSQPEELKWGLGSLDIPGAIKVPTEEYIQRYSCSNFLDEDTLIFTTNFMRDYRFAIYEYKISEQTLRQVYENEGEILLGSHMYVNVSRIDETSLLVSTSEASMRFSLPDYMLISDVESPVRRKNIYPSKTEMFDPLDLYEERIKTPEWGYGYYYDGGKVFIKFGHPFDGSDPMKLGFVFAEEGKPPTVLEVPMECFPDLIPPKEGRLNGFDLREAEYAPDKPYFVARVKIEGGIYGVRSVSALLVCNYETGEYYLSEFVPGNSTINIPVFNEDQSKVLVMADDFKSTAYKEAHMSTFLIDIEELLKHGRGGSE